MTSTNPFPNVSFDSSGRVLTSSPDLNACFSNDVLRDIFIRCEAENCLNKCADSTPVSFNINFSEIDTLSPIEYLVIGHKNTSAGSHSWMISFINKSQYMSEVDEMDQHLVSLKRMLSILSHEFRNPLTGAQLCVEFLNEHFTRSKENIDLASTRKTIKLLTQNLNSMTSLMDDLNNYHTYENGFEIREFEKVDIRLLIESVTRSMGDAHRVVFTTDENSVAFVDGDTSRLEQVLHNIVNNALKFSSHKDELVRVTLSVTPDSCAIEITDKGVGVDKKELELLTRPFYQVDSGLARETGGFGLGLYIVKSIVEAHNGHISFDSDGLGEGLSVKLVFPLSNSSKNTKTDSNTKYYNSEIDRALIDDDFVLFVDDQQSVLDSYKLIFESLGCKNFYFSNNVNDALEILSEIKMNLVFTDLGMPIMDGYQLKEHFEDKVSNGKPEWVLISGYGDSTERSYSSLKGFKQHLVKPVTVQQILDAIKQSRESQND